ncbi:formylglycine-generating enzyme family protein [Candidatus Uabimicrobium sp. HlEnr_7]|uniref:formylglycine-generating enzyme family protein n=1 Tax=Candidatus Uabimicrobium helgolandensis TaxID=3095367 RepID=UPI0035564BB5
MKQEVVWVSFCSLAVCCALFIVHGGIEIYIPSTINSSPIVSSEKPKEKKTQIITVPSQTQIPKEYSIWRNKGKRAEKNNDIVLAIRCYSWALNFYQDENLQRHISILSQKINQQDLQTLQHYNWWKQALHYENNYQYNKAISTYKKLKQHKLFSHKVQKRIKYCREQISKSLLNQQSLNLAKKLQKQGHFKAALKQYQKINSSYARDKIKALSKIHKVHLRVQKKAQKLIKQKRYVYALRYISHPSLNKNYFSNLFPDLHAKVHQNLALVPEGHFVFGNDSHKDESPETKIHLPAFYICKHEVTNAQYYDYIKHSKASAPQHWERGVPNSLDLQKPVTGVSWNEAVNYCNWMGVRLPSEQEWEKAARGSQGFVYPWGNSFYKNHANTIEEGLKDTSTVARFSSGKSYYGCYDMIGNVLEWTANNYEVYEGNSHFLPIRPGYKVARGGSWYYKGISLRCSKRYPQQPQVRMLALGFRYVIDIDQLGTRYE